MSQDLDRLNDQDKIDFLTVVAKMNMMKDLDFVNTRKRQHIKNGESVQLNQFKDIKSVNYDGKGVYFCGSRPVKICKRFADKIDD